MESLKPLYNVKLIENGKAHFYQLGEDETWHPGVTSVLKVMDKPALLPWALNSMGENIKKILTDREIKPWEEGEIETIVKDAKNIYKKKSSEAADIGGRVHKAIDEIIHGRQPDITDDIKSGVDGFLAWKESHKLEIQLGDTKLGSKLFGYGGSLDFVAFDNNDPIIFDIKTTKKRKDRDHGAYDEYGLQLSAYVQAFTETYGIRPTKAYVLWLNKEKPEFKAIKVSNIDKCFEGFLAALKLYQLQKFELFENSL